MMYQLITLSRAEQDQHPHHHARGVEHQLEHVQLLAAGRAEEQGQGGCVRHAVYTGRCPVLSGS